MVLCNLNVDLMTINVLLGHAKVKMGMLNLFVMVSRTLNIWKINFPDIQC